jgi:SAM-dependent methyltransferase
MSEHNQRGYDQWAATYDTDPNSTVAADDLAFPRLWSALRGQRVLELGCGTGRHTTRLLAQDNTVVALDLSAEMLARARARCPGVHFVHGDVLTLAPDALGEPFQAALSALVLEHVADLPRYFGVLAAHLRPGARYYVSELHPARAQAGRLAHFVDAATGRETWLESTAHAEGSPGGGGGHGRLCLCAPRGRAGESGAGRAVAEVSRAAADADVDLRATLRLGRPRGAACRAGPWAAPRRLSPPPPRSRARTVRRAPPDGRRS